MMEHMEKDIIKRIKCWQKSSEIFPVKLQYNPTNICNLNCVFCRDNSTSLLKKNRVRFLNWFDLKKELKLHHMIRIADEAVDMKVRHFFIGGGGEPFMRRETLLLMKRVKSNGIYGDVITNGTLLTQETVKDIVEMHWDHVHFSIDGIGEVHNNLRQTKGAFERIIKAIKNIQHEKKNAKVDRPTLGFSMVLCTTNLLQVTKLMKFVANLGLDSFNVNPLKEYFRINKKLILDKSHSKLLQAELRKARDFANKIGMETNLDSFIRDKKLTESINEMSTIIKKRSKGKGILCYAPWYVLAIDPYGNVGCCCERIGENKENNVKKKSLKQIWESSYFKTVRNNILKYELSNACERCGTWQVDIMEGIRKELEKD